MELSFTERKSIRKNFGKLKESLSIPNLIEVQKNSYEEFLASKSKNIKENSLDKGLQRVFSSVFPINDASEKSSLEFISYRLSKPKFDVTECRQRSSYDLLGFIRRYLSAHPERSRRTSA